MAAHIKFDFVAETLLDTGHNQVRTFRRVELFLQIGLVEPGYVPLAGFIGYGCNSASASCTCAFSLNFPDQTHCSCQFIERDTGDFFKFAIVAMITRKVEQQVAYRANAKMVQTSSHCLAYTGHGGNIGAQEGQSRVSLRHPCFQAHSIWWWRWWWLYGHQWFRGRCFRFCCSCLGWLGGRCW